MKLAEMLYQAGRGSVTATETKAMMFQPLDKEHVRKRTKLQERAKENGLDNIPRSDSEELDSVESDIVSAIGDAKRQYVDDYDRQIQAYGQRIKQYKDVLVDFSIVNKFKATMGDLKALVSEQKAILFDRQEAVKAITNEILRFRKDHNLLHRTPVPKNKLATAAHILVAGVIEIILTSLLIRDSGSLLAVAGVAAVFFVLNILVVFFIFSYFAKYVHACRRTRPDWMRRSFGLGVLASFIVYTITINLVFSHLRSVSSETERLLAENPEQALQTFQNIGAIAWSQFIENGFVLQDVNSYALLLLGGTLSLYTFVVGFNYGDSYPGYGKYIERYQETLDDYDDVMNETLDLFKDKRDEGIRAAEEQVKEIKTAYKRIPDFAEQASHLYKRFIQAEEDLNNHLRTLLQEYRENNMRAREEPVPERFLQPIVLEKTDVPVLQAPELSFPEKTVEEISQHRNDVYRLFEDAIKEVKDIRKILEHQYPFSVNREEYAS